MIWFKKKPELPKKVFGRQPYKDRFIPGSYWRKPRVRMYALIERKGNVYTLPNKERIMFERQNALLNQYADSHRQMAGMQAAQMAYGRSGLACQSPLAGLGLQGIF